MSSAHDDMTLWDLLQHAARLHLTPEDEACLAALLKHAASLTLPAAGQPPCVAQGG